MSRSKRRIAMALDEGLLAALDRRAAEQSKSRESFISQAVEQALRQVERARIDVAFAEMADDTEYGAELRRIEAETDSASNPAWGFVPER